jgi:hypothetical protein
MTRENNHNHKTAPPANNKRKTIFLEVIASRRGSYIQRSKSKNDQDIQGSIIALIAIAADNMIYHRLGLNVHQPIRVIPYATRIHIHRNISCFQKNGPSFFRRKKIVATTNQRKTQKALA